MRPLTETLLAAQRRLAGGQPVLKLEISDRPVEIPRWDWQVASSEATATCHGATAATRDGGVLRARVTAAGALQVCRVIDPAIDDWTAGWTTLAPGPYSTTAQVAVAARPDADVALIAYVSADGRTLWYRVSNDGGYTWGAETPALQVAPGASIKGVGTCSGTGYVYLAYTVDSGAVEPNDTLFVGRYGNAWAWCVGQQNGLNGLTGCGTMVEGNGNTQRVVVAGIAGLTRYDYDWGTTAWTGPVALVTTAAGSGFSASYPRLAKSPDGSGRYFFTWLEAWTIGSPGSRYWFATSPSPDVIGEGLLFDTNRGKGWDVFTIGATWYFACAVAHYSAPSYTGSATQRKDVGADVVAFELAEEGPNRPTRGRIWLNNADGRYANPGTGGYAMLREGSRVCLAAGYHTSAGPEAVWLPPLWVEGWTHEDANGEGWLAVAVGDAWSFLERCVMRFPLSYSGLTYGQIAQRLCYRVSASALAAVGGLGIVADAFTVRAGETVGSVLRRVLDGAGVRLRFSTAAVAGDPGAWDAAVATALAIGEGASSYAFGPAGHRMLRGEYTGRGQRANLFEVYGKGWWTWGWDKEHILEAGHVFLRKDADWFLDSGADVGDRAERLKRGEQRRLNGGWIEVLPHLGAELYDVVDVSDERAGLTAAARRVSGIRWRYDSRQAGRWRQRLELEGV